MQKLTNDAARDLHRLSIAVEAPAHAGLEDLLDYESDQPVAAGTLVRVPLGAREVPGIVWRPQAASGTDRPLRPVGQVLSSLGTLPALWLALVEFSARYYQRSLGDIALSVLPPELRKLDDSGVAKRLAKLNGAPPTSAKASKAAPRSPDDPAPSLPKPEASPEQAQLLAVLSPLLAQPDPPCVLLHGVTGSGKTEVYLRAAEQVLATGRQVLVLVPEINLTPQLEQRFAARFPGRCLVSLHSALTPVQRLSNWLRAHGGQAELVLGTRLAIFASLPRLGLIVVDEEHDASYKQQDGARYSARDLAVYRGRLEKVPVLLGSATPSLETWQHALSGRYRHLTMAARIGDGALPTVRMIDMSLLPKVPGQPPPALAPPLLDAVRERIARGEQSLLFLNRRGFAPVLQCTACGWKSGCPHCSAWRVFHKLDRTLRCHHCGHTERVPKACPDCGNLDIEPIGRGTEQLEEQVAALLPEARVARIDADTTRLKGSLQSQLAAVHAGEVDVLVGTQMITKGHDFRRVTLVAAVNPDSALFAADFRAPERLFASLMQAAGRAGRDAQAAARSEMFVQTWNPQHALFAALRRHDFAAFAASQLAERQMAGLPPFSHLALLRTEARQGDVAEGFLRAAKAEAQALPQAQGVVFYSPVPPQVARVAGFERRQMLVESESRAALQRLLAAWLPGLTTLRGLHKGVVRWAVDVDPLGI